MHNFLHENFRYTDEDHNQYLKNGYLFFDHFLSPVGLKLVQTATDRLLAALPEGASTEGIICPHLLGETWVYELATEPKLLDMVEKQVGPNIVLWVTHLLCKKPRTGNMVPWHQDAPYWNVTKLSPGLWIPLSDVDRENGAMAVLPEWHRKGVLPVIHSNANDAFDEEIQPYALPPNVDELKVEYTLKAGQMAIHDVYMPHNSPPNRSERWRKTLIIRYMAADGDMGPKLYKNYRDGSTFNREYLLVRGEDILNRGLKRFEEMALSNR